MITFNGHGVGAHPITIMPERITHWTLVERNGMWGTCIYLDTGTSIVVEAYPEDVGKKVREALDNG